MRLRLLLAGSAALVLVVTASGLLWMRAWLETPLAIDEMPVRLEVRPGMPLRAAAEELESLGVLTRPLLFSAYARLSGQAASIKAGEYELRGPLTPESLLHQLVEGRVLLYSVTIPEGWSLAELLGALEANPAINSTLAGADAEAVAQQLGLDVAHAEGQFFPETYSFPRGTTDAEVLAQAHDLMRDELREAWESRAPDLPLGTPYELLILASIIEKETALDEERARIAGVFIRRLRKNMRLQTDPTVIYGLGAGFDGNLTRGHLNTDTPYNTYTRAGLPPTPIGLPGAASLRAAASPEEGSALYFVATGEPDGSHYFADTLEEHQEAVRRYLARLREKR